MTTGTDVDKAELRALIADVLDVEPEAVTEDAHFIQDLGVDSLIALELAVTLERRYGIKLTEDEIVDVKRLPDVHTLVLSKLAP